MTETRAAPPDIPAHVHTQRAKTAHVKQTSYGIHGAVIHQNKLALGRLGNTFGPTLSVFYYLCTSVCYSTTVSLSVCQSSPLSSPPLSLPHSLARSLARSPGPPLAVFIVSSEIHRRHRIRTWLCFTKQILCPP